MINSKILLHSVNPKGCGVITFDLTFPRIILSELNRHRAFSPNTSSSRAIPLKKTIEAINENMFVPYAFMKQHKGMQGTEFLTGNDEVNACYKWAKAAKNAIDSALSLNEIGCSKQICNRLLEPFMWTREVLTTSEAGLMNMFYQRCPRFKDPITGTIHFSYKEYCKTTGANPNISLIEKLTLAVNGDEEREKSSAEIHFMLLAEMMYDQFLESIPQQLNENEWHIPIIGNDIDLSTNEKIKVCTSMMARFSYTSIGDEKETTIQKHIELHDNLINQDPLHWSPLEHAMKATNDTNDYFNFKGFKNYRYLKSNEGFNI